MTTSAVPAGAPLGLAVRAAGCNPARRGEATVWEATCGEGCEAAVFDAGGRRVRAFPSVRGTARLGWDGRDARASVVPAGIYFLQLRSSRGSATARCLRRQ